MAVEFFTEAKLPSRLNLELWVKNWTGLTRAGSGIVLVSDTDGVLNGAIGGLAYNDLNDGARVLAEAFWFTTKGARGAGLALLKGMEAWCRASGIKRIHMIHLHSLNERLGRIYERMGYRLVESAYVKDI